MIKRYIKQTWAMLKQHKLFGSLYIIGTAIPVALTMIVITFQYIRRSTAMSCGVPKLSIMVRVPWGLYP